MNRLSVTPVICAMVLAAIAYDARAASVAGIYWSTTTRSGMDKIQRADLQGGNQKVYWSDMGSDKIERADFNGANRQNVITGVNAFGPAITGSGMLYWTETSTGKIQRSNLNGNNQEDFITGSDRPFALAVIPLPASLGAGMTMLDYMEFVAMRRTWSTRR